jgi:hypothetical protein
MVFVMIHCVTPVSVPSTESGSLLIRCREREPTAKFVTSNCGLQLLTTVFTHNFEGA